MSNKHTKALTIFPCTFLLIALTGCGTNILSPQKSPPLSSATFKTLDKYAERSELAYKTPEVIRKKLPHATRVGTTKSDVQYIIELDPSERSQTVSIRGTANKKNVFQDADLHMVDDPGLGILIHKGFNDDTNEVYGEVKPVLNKDYRTSVTGHSLGGAIAVLLALKLEKDGYDIDRVVTFGQPKFTNAEGVKAYEDLPLHRVVHHLDIVPMLPPGSWVSSSKHAYEHLGPETIVNNDGSFTHILEHDAERLSVGEFWRNIRHESLNDHHVSAYRQVLDAIAKKLRKPVN
ncbi:MAG: lipase family protein [Luteolibacter sp.]